MVRSGIGYDIHRLVEGRKLILGGVDIPHIRGLEGHSDADVLTHAIADALLGAAGDRDIGHHFPNSDESIKGIDSQEILRRGRDSLTANNLATVENELTPITDGRPIDRHRSTTLERCDATPSIR